MEEVLRNLPLEQLAVSPFGEKLQRAAEVLDKCWRTAAALHEKQGEAGITGMKALSVTAFAILGKIVKGKNPSELSDKDWKDIAKVVSEYAIIMDDESYSVFVFRMYESYIRSSVNDVREVISPKAAQSIDALAEELHSNTEALLSGHMTETRYIEDCLWTSLDAMFKLVACSVSLFGDDQAQELTQAVAEYALEYARLKMYGRELEIVNSFLASQRQLDEKLYRKYEEYMADLKAESGQFYMLLDRAFSPDFGNAFLSSVLLAEAVGVKTEEILSSSDDIDSFFLD